MYVGPYPLKMLLTDFIANNCLGPSHTVAEYNGDGL